MQRVRPCWPKRLDAAVSVLIPVVGPAPLDKNHLILFIYAVHDAVLIRQTDGIASGQIPEQPLAIIGISGDYGG